MRILSFVLILLVGNIVRADDAEDAIKKARSALSKGEHDAALKAAEDAVKLAPKNALARFVRGEAKAHFRQHREAIADYEKAFELDPKLMVAINQRGGERFKLGLVKESIEDFDKYIDANPKGYEDHWRRGISLYYAERFADGAKQFKAGDKVYGNDVENAFWHYLCTARVDGVEKARKALLAIGKDGRVPMMKVYDMIQGKAKPEEVVETGRRVGSGGLNAAPHFDGPANPGLGG